MREGVPGRLRKKSAQQTWGRSRVVGMTGDFSLHPLGSISPRLGVGIHLLAVPKTRHEEGVSQGAQGDQSPWKLPRRPLRLCFPPALGLDSKRVCKTGNLTDKGKGEGAGKYPVPIRILGKHAAKTGREKNGKKERKTNSGVSVKSPG